MRYIALLCIAASATWAAKPSKEESNEPVGPCGPVPSNSIMMAALKSASKMLMNCIDILNEYPVRALILHDAMETICEHYDSCIKLGKGEPSHGCFKDHAVVFLEQHKDKIPFDAKAAGDKIFTCVLKYVPGKKLEVFSAIHWLLLMLKS